MSESPDYLSAGASIQTLDAMDLNEAPSVSFLAKIYVPTGKRVFDIAVSLMMLIAFAPLLFFLLAVVAVCGGQPIFAHARIGQYGRPFKCLKIRSMHRDADAKLVDILARDPVSAMEWARYQKLSNDSRVTRIGSFLRKSSLDELPQLLNVLRGDMSLVGPRPITAAELDRYGLARNDYIQVRPGITGPWQVGGRNSIDYNERVALDSRYARSHSFFGDFRIILKTVAAVFHLSGS